jgi:hypothetical protein
LDQKCFEAFIASGNDSGCDFQTLNIMKKELDGIFEEIYGNLPVNGICIQEKTTQEEFNLTFSILHVWKDDLHEVDKREILEKFQELFRILLNKLSTCFDSEAFFKKSLSVYEHLEDEKMKNCTIKIANTGKMDGECSKLIEVICEHFHIDEIFLETSSFIGIESLINDTRKFSKIINDKQLKLVKVLQGVSGDHEAFDKFYKNFLKEMLSCLYGHQSSTTVDYLVKLNETQTHRLNASSFFHFLVSVNYFIVVFVIFLLFLLILASFEGRRDRRRYVRLR